MLKNIGEDYKGFECVGCNYMEQGCKEKVCPYKIEIFKEWCKKQKLKNKCNDSCEFKSYCIKEV
ncbi:hypothetical protein [Cetobacterium sp.]|uniref:hypothetical protein n=1 Tax=Cetobacterium sp. TaxID=2071632 RepID=UPI003F2A7186